MTIYCYLYYKKKSKTIKDNQRQSKAVKGSQRQSKTIKDNQRQSKEIKSNMMFQEPPRSGLHIASPIALLTLHATISFFISLSR